MEHIFTCTCGCLFSRYIRDGQEPVANCKLCGESVKADFNTRDTRRTARVGLTLIPDIQDFRSPVDNSVIGSRAALREHNKRNDVVQIGNDKVSRTEAAPMPRAGYDVKRALETARSR